MFPGTSNPQPAADVSSCAGQILINAGQANAATGDQGYQDCITSAEALASALGVSSSDILLESTGVIGRRIKIDELVAAIPKITQDLENSAEAAMHAAIAITTTDLVSKSAAIEVSALASRPSDVGLACQESCRQSCNWQQRAGSLLQIGPAQRPRPRWGLALTS